VEVCFNNIVPQVKRASGRRDKKAGRACWIITIYGSRLRRVGGSEESAGWREKVREYREALSGGPLIARLAFVSSYHSDSSDDNSSEVVYETPSSSILAMLS